MKVLSKKLVRKPVQKRSLDKLNTILAVSKELFAKKNYFNVTTNEIAKEAGISIGTLYSYFSNKEEILSLILKDYNESFIVIFNQLNTSENLELFSSDYKGWIEKLIDNLISLEDKEFHAQIEMLSYSIPEVKEIQDQHNDKMKELTYQCLKHYVDNKEITNLKSISNVLFNFITSIVDEILYSSHSDEEITALRKTSLDCIALILENLLTL
ncbi:TetR/AcrR family transcriptional regulator [Streptococcus sanguinis]|jgi:putative transcriptional regulator (tetR/acrR family)|uniref:TetR/AcrR family transcriptional regulator n=1 Tax=Streptococcus sanguinis TaxID=1305 RepID=UPI000204D0D4|nr:TetR/AcrR family transcriptional regulator [Streptococcus sanguinis]EGF07590.1 TetR/AcrR family transcriptional regulator [Streptococcus sanguinis SK1057]MBZ2024957.1 TetR/AcrR family transcriptional regulator [Streptococcus sanguinis]RSI02218.1 HTH-type transcriptional regulator SrpR [Streptococcus sanguinis]RSI46336.1 HTH-type transcriptional regulator SrpR [Streptococcus sanguinis]RSI64528.1 HTH-type transcriptional regulator SrpR [Streptococcus sanguinis]